MNYLKFMIIALIILATALVCIMQPKIRKRTVIYSLKPIYNQTK